MFFISTKKMSDTSEEVKLIIALFFVLFSRPLAYPSRVLAVKNLRVEFGPRVIFKDLTFSIGDKERIAFAGHNGAGKSTLMKCIGGVLQQNAG
ncbi:ATP-binding cassette domain-containing protein [bacterium]|nr:ATP-binding cassette domain-containing protein [bacterium]